MDWRRTVVTAAVLAGLAACARPPAAIVSSPSRVTAGYEETGNASWYGAPYHGRRTASGEIYDMGQMTAAHRTLPFGIWVLVEKQLSGQMVEVRITDRGPFVKDRILDVSAAAARMLGAIAPGVIPIRLRVIDAPIAPAGIRSGVFSVQVSSFTSERRAQVLRDELARADIDASIQRAEVGGHVFYRVRTGTYPTRAEADQMARRLARGGYDVIVTAE